MVVGLGSMGSNHFRVLSENPAVDVFGIDPSLDNDRLLDPKILESPEELEGFDGIVLAVPTDLHSKVLDESLSSFRGKILVEKPLVESVSELDGWGGEPMNVVVGHLERFNTAYDILANIPKEQILAIEFHRLGGARPSTLGNDPVMDLIIHDIDLLAYHVESEIISTRVHKLFDGTTPLESVLFGETASGISFSCKASYLHFEKQRYARVRLVDKIILIDGMRRSVTTETLISDHLGSSDVQGLALLRGGNRTLKITETLTLTEPLRMQDDAFVEYCKTGVRDSRLCSYNDAMQLIALLGEVESRRF